MFAGNGATEIKRIAEDLLEGDHGAILGGSIARVGNE